jgi:hypothetical protein
MSVMLHRGAGPRAAVQLPVDRLPLSELTSGQATSSCWRWWLPPMTPGQHGCTGPLMEPTGPCICCTTCARHMQCPTGPHMWINSTGGDKGPAAAGHTLHIIHDPVGWVATPFPLEGKDHEALCQRHCTVAVACSASPAGLTCVLAQHVAITQLHALAHLSLAPVCTRHQHIQQTPDELDAHTRRACS